MGLPRERSDLRGNGQVSPRGHPQVFGMACPGGHHLQVDAGGMALALPIEKITVTTNVDIRYVMTQNPLNTWRGT